MRCLMTFSYDGNNYKGYQKQNEEMTIQGEIERVLKKIFNKDVSIHSSGRTDAKVHALNQKAHFDLPKKMDLDKLKHALNGLSNDDIFIKDIVSVDKSFHARFNVKAKEYIYKINMGEYNPIERNYVYQYNKRLDIVEMERALKHLEGTNDYTSFAKLDEDKDCVRTIVQTNLIRNIKNVNEITLVFLGTGFLRYQIRNMVGTLIEVGEGKRKSEDILKIINYKDRTKAGVTAPSEGLYLKDVVY